VSMNTFEIKSSVCSGCGACSSIAPETFSIEDRVAIIRRQPQNKSEHRLAEASLLNCPRIAIQLTDEDVALEEVQADVGYAFTSLVKESEGSRWRVSDIPWEKLEPSLVTPSLRALIREMAFSEQTTYSATTKFMQAFYDNIDFTQWIAIWFYEETRHPYILMQWLSRMGETFDEAFVLKGRVSTPFMKSLTGTLVTNVISEMVAAYSYHALSKMTKEPTLASIAEHLSCDEARHAAGFIRYAHQRIANAKDKRREQLDGLKVLHMWLNSNDSVTHPINQMVQRLESSKETGASKFLNQFEFHFDRVQVRITRLVGLLLELPLRKPEDVFPMVQSLIESTHTRGAL
jgi:ferredoxin/ferritin